jgi:hypothetical protein
LPAAIPFRGVAQAPVVVAGRHGPRQRERCDGHNQQRGELEKFAMDERGAFVSVTGRVVERSHVAARSCAWLKI